eukprot:COSAG01_NODE_21185_length_914_cov_0.954601_1_plen_128_part_00
MSDALRSLCAKSSAKLRLNAAPCIGRRAFHHTTRVGGVYQATWVLVHRMRPTAARGIATILVWRTQLTRHHTPSHHTRDLVASLQAKRKQLLAQRKALEARYRAQVLELEKKDEALLLAMARETQFV